MDNEDRVDAVLDTMQRDNDAQAFAQCLNILNKLASNIKSNPFEQKFRGVKVSNNTIKSKIMSLKGADQLLATLGFKKQSEELLFLNDEEIGDFMQGVPAVEYRLRIAAARLNSEAEYKKELELIKYHKEQRAQLKKKEEEGRRLKQQCKNDKLERAHMKVDETKSNQLKFGSKATTYKDIGVDLCKPKGG